VTDFLDTKRREITERLRELKPLVEEYHRLEAAASALEGLGGRALERLSGRGSNGRTRAAGCRTPARRSAAGGTRRRGRPRGSGTRSLQALELVRSRPGITIPDLAKEMGIKQNYLYRVLPALARDGQVAKRGRGWHPKAGKSAAGSAAKSPAKSGAKS
jgi:hypothetical protein